MDDVEWQYIVYMYGIVRRYKVSFYCSFNYVRYLFRFYMSFQVFSCTVLLVAVCFNPGAVSPSGIFCGHLVTDSGCSPYFFYVCFL